MTKRFNENRLLACLAGLALAVLAGPSALAETVNGSTTAQRIVPSSTLLRSVGSDYEPMFVANTIAVCYKVLWPGRAGSHDLEGHSAYRPGRFSLAIIEFCLEHHVAVVSDWNLVNRQPS